MRARDKRLVKPLRIDGSGMTGITMCMCTTGSYSFMISSPSQRIVHRFSRIWLDLSSMARLPICRQLISRRHSILSLTESFCTASQVTPSIQPTIAILRTRTSHSIQPVKINPHKAILRGTWRVNMRRQEEYVPDIRQDPSRRTIIRRRAVDGFV